MILEARIKTASGERVEAVVKLEGVRMMNVALLVLLVDVLEWPDTQLPAGFLDGFSVIGVIAADSGIHRLLNPPPLGDLGEFTETFDKDKDKVMTTNVSWNREVVARWRSTRRQHRADPRRQVAITSNSFTMCGKQQQEKSWQGGLDRV